MFTYALCGSALTWSFNVLMVAARNVMASVLDYVAIETALTFVQWIVVAPLTVLVFDAFDKKRAMQ